MSDDTSRLYVSIDRSGLTPRYIASPHMHPGAREWIPRDAVRVKPLEWVRHPTAEIWRCDTMLGTYKVFGIGPFPTWDFDSATDAKDATSKREETHEAAKAAAQADYQARIMSALAALPAGAQEEG